jgi:large-conductance mechanosensitive channel
MNEHNHNTWGEFWRRLLQSLILTALLTFLAVPLLVDAQALGASTQEATKEYFGQKALDWFDVQLMLETVKLYTVIVGLIVVFLVGAMMVYRTSKTQEALDKKIEDEANEIKAFNAQVVSRLLEAISDQQKKDIFQTIAQGQAALYKPKE